MEDHLNLWLGNGISIAAIAATFMGWVPGIAALVALAWYLIQIYESETARHFLANRRARRIARLRAKLLTLEAPVAEHRLLPKDDG